MEIKSEDYEEPACLLCMDDELKRHIPISRIIEKLDEHLGRNDYDAAVRHLEYWLHEAEFYGDKRGIYAVKNEEMGLYRKLGNKEKALDAAAQTLALIDELGFDNTVTAATAYVNAATVYKAFGDPAGALPLYEKARMIYEHGLDGGDARLGGLYNNTALALVELNRFDEAFELYEAALNIMSKNRYGELEMAITYLNMADAELARDGAENASGKIDELIEKAAACLGTPGIPQDGYYAFVCEKCASAFGYHGYFLYEADFSERARRIYEGS